METTAYYSPQEDTISRKPCVVSHATCMLHLHLLTVFSDCVKVVVWDNIILAERV